MGSFCIGMMFVLGSLAYVVLFGYFIWANPDFGADNTQRCWGHNDFYLPVATPIKGNPTAMDLKKVDVTGYIMKQFGINFTLVLLVILCFVVKMTNIVGGCRSRYNCGHKLNMVLDVFLMIFCVIMFFMAVAQTIQMQYTPYKACTG